MQACSKCALGQKILYPRNGNDEPMVPFVLFFHGPIYGQQKLLNLLASQIIHIKLVRNYMAYNNCLPYLLNIKWKINFVNLRNFHLH